MKYKILKKNFWYDEIITNCAKLCANGTFTFEDSMNKITKQLCQRTTRYLLAYLYMKERFRNET